MPRFLGQLRVYLCPSDVAGISKENRRLGLCHSSRELALDHPERSLFKFHFKRLGALTVVPTLSRVGKANVPLLIRLALFVSNPGHAKRKPALTNLWEPAQSSSGQARVICGFEIGNSAWLVP